ncbi:hypothetical protein Lepto7375DRAFT_7053 [Leptolyngbya sp. PCC 7375]|nr:hypothetical protein Lepto7375DRAFT_7053 [Leptolyngbya sp. PCC 7375]
MVAPQKSRHIPYRHSDDAHRAVNFRRPVLMALTVASMSALSIGLPMEMGRPALASDWGAYIPDKPSKTARASDVPELPLVHISSARNIDPLNTALGTEFLAQVPGSNVEISSRETQDALDAVQSGDIDLAIVDRPLTEEEIEKGLVSVPIGDGDLAYVYDGPTPSDAARPFLDFVEDPANQDTVEEAVTLVEPSSLPEDSAPPEESAPENRAPENRALEDSVTETSTPESGEPTETVKPEDLEEPAEAEEPTVQDTVQGPATDSSSDDIALIPSPDSDVTPERAIRPFPWGWLALPLLGLPLLFWLRRDQQQPEVSDHALRDWDNAEPSLPDPLPSETPLPPPDVTDEAPVLQEPLPSSSDPSFAKSPTPEPATEPGNEPVDSESNIHNEAIEAPDVTPELTHLADLPDQETEIPGSINAVPDAEVPTIASDSVVNAEGVRESVAPDALNQTDVASSAMPDASETTKAMDDGADLSSLTTAGLGAAALAGLGAAALAQDTTDAEQEESAPEVPGIAPVEWLSIEPESSEAVSVRWPMAEEQQRILLTNEAYAPQVKIYDATGIDLDHQAPHSVDSHPVTEGVFDGDGASMLLPVARCDRDYLAELGYEDANNQWISLGRSLHTRVPCPPQPDPVSEVPEPAPEPAPEVISPAPEEPTLTPEHDDISADASPLPLAGLGAGAAAAGLVAGAIMQDASDQDVEPDASEPDISEPDVSEPDVDTHVARPPVATPQPEALAEPPISQAIPPVAPVFSSSPNQTDGDHNAEVPIAPFSKAKTCHQRLTVDSQEHTYTFDENQISALQSTANRIPLTPGCYILTLDPQNINNSPRVGEPSVILWIYGGRFINQKTNVEAASTWSTLNGYNDSLTLNVLEPSTVCAFFLDTTPKIDSHQLTLLILKDN